MSCVGFGEAGGGGFEGTLTVFSVSMVSAGRTSGGFVCPELVEGAVGCEGTGVVSCVAFGGAGGAGGAGLERGGVAGGGG